MARDRSFDKGKEEEAFRTTFQLLANTLGPNAFRRYDQSRNRFLGGFSISAFEAVALGVGYNFRNLDPASELLSERAKSVWSNPIFLANSGAGVRASTRIPRIVPVGRSLFAI